MYHCVTAASVVFPGHGVFSEGVPSFPGRNAMTETLWDWIPAWELNMYKLFSCDEEIHVASITVPDARMHVWYCLMALHLFLCGYGSIPIDTFLVGWTSIYQLFWGSLGTRVLTHPYVSSFQSRNRFDIYGTYICSSKCRVRPTDP